VELFVDSFVLVCAANARAIVIAGGIFFGGCFLIFCGLCAMARREE